MSMLVNGKAHIDLNNVPLASLVAQDEDVDVNFIKNNNFSNNAYRNNFGSNNLMSHRTSWENPRGRYDEHSSKFSLSMKPRFNRPVGEINHF
jgi:hypothetical protein